MSGQTTILELSIEPGSDPIRGSFALAGGPPRAFNGWIELTAAIEEAREGDKTVGSLPGASDEDLRQALP
jgi:hypothetical protein